MAKYISELLPKKEVLDENTIYKSLSANDESRAKNLGSYTGKATCMDGEASFRACTFCYKPIVDGETAIRYRGWDDKRAVIICIYCSNYISEFFLVGADET